MCAVLIGRKRLLTMKRLYTELEFVRFYMYIPIIGLMAMIVGSISQFGWNENTLDFLFVWAGVCVILELMLFFVWCPSEYKKKMAIKYGKEYTGTIKAIRIKEKKRYIVYKRNYVFVIVIETVIGEKKYIVENGVYSDDPGKYLCVGDICKVYFYNGEIYPEVFWVNKRKSYKKTEQINIQQRHLAVPILSYCCMNQTKSVLILITLKTYNKCKNLELIIYEKLVTYFEKIEKEDGLRDTIKEIVEQTIYEYDVTIEIQEVKIIIK